MSFQNPDSQITRSIIEP